MKLSVLDLVPVRAGQSSAEAVTASRTLARIADEVGVHRYWFAEHHNMPSVASTSPAVFAAAVAAETSRIRIGSGGVMLPNHAPLIVAEQFAALEALAPGRIDLGLGRAPGSDPLVSHVLRTSGPGGDPERFGDHVADILAIMSPEGARVRLTSGRDYTLASTPAAGSVPPVWLLGSSDFSARLAASLGLPYVFAGHFSIGGLDQALRLYRDGFTPSEWVQRPTTFLTANVSVGDSREDAIRLAMPQLRVYARLRSGAPLQAIETVEQALANPLPDAQQAVIADLVRDWYLGTADEVAASLTAFAERHGVDEVMVQLAMGATETDSLDRIGAREQGLRALAGSLGLA